MQKKLVYIILAIILVLGVIGFILVYRFINEAKDYVKVLSVTPPSSTNSPKIKETPLAEFKTPGIVVTEGIDSENADEEKAEFKEQHNINLLLLGIDKTTSREDWLKIYRTDSIALASIDLDSKKVNILSIPRDTYTYIPCIGKKDKINHAYAFGGMDEKGIESTIDAVNQFIKYSKVDYFFSLDMEPIPQIVDYLGGIDLDVDVDMEEEGIRLKKGMQKLNGEESFVYIHWRFGGNGDIDRIQRQQIFAKAMVNKLKEKDQLVKAAKVVLDYRNNIKTNLSTKQLLALVSLLKNIAVQDVNFYTIPGTGEYINGISYWIPDSKGVEEVLSLQFK